MQPMYAHMLLRAAAGRSTTTRWVGRQIPFRANLALPRSNPKALLMSCRGFSSPAAATSTTTTEPASHTVVSTGTATTSTSEDWVRDVIQKIMLEQSQLSTTTPPVNEGLSSSARDLEKSLQALQVRRFIVQRTTIDPPVFTLYFFASYRLLQSLVISSCPLCRFACTEHNLSHRTN
jgi:hypothetical protein